MSLLASSGTRGEPHLPHGLHEETWCQNISGSAGPGLARGLQAAETGTCEGHDLQACFQVNEGSSGAAGSPLTALEETELLLMARCETRLMVCKAFWQMSPGNIICHLAAANFMGFVICTVCLEAMVAGMPPRLALLQGVLAQNWKDFYVNPWKKMMRASP